jgi:hypothetical protein
MAHAASDKKTSMSLAFTVLAISSSDVHNMFSRTACIHSSIAFACGFLILNTGWLTLYPICISWGSELKCELASCCFHHFNMINFLCRVIAKQKIITKEKRGRSLPSVTQSVQSAADVCITLHVSSPQISAAVPRMKCVGHFLGAS